MTEPVSKILDETISTNPMDHGGRGNSTSIDQPTLPPNSSSTSAIAPQSTLKIFGDYQIESEIARGGMGVVYRARQVSLNRTVALKMILSGNLAGDDDVKRFHAEAEASAKLDHPNIVPIYEIGQHDGQHFFSMGFVDGGSLDRLLNENTLPAKTAVQLMISVCEAIQFAHENGIVHRDLKPANILLANVGNSRSGSTTGTFKSNQAKATGSSSSPRFECELEWIPKVSDFGLAKRLNSKSELTGTGQILGTPSYMPPEQAEGDNESVGALSDVYSLGAILYRTLAGRPPFQSSSPMETILQLLQQDPVPPRQLNPSIPTELETICLKCLQKDPAKRYESAGALADDLARWLRGDPILARPQSMATKVMRWVRKHPAICSSALVLTGSIVAVFGILAKSNKSLANERDIAVKAQLEADSQRSTAQSRLTRAIESINKTAARVNGKRWTMDPTLQDERKAILENTIQFYGGLIEDESDTEEVRYQAVKAYEQVASSKLLLNDLSGSMEACKKSLELCRTLSIEHPERPDYTARLAALLSLSGSVNALAGNLQPGIEQMWESTQVSRSVSKAHPSNDAYQKQALEAMSHYAYFVLSSPPENRESGQSLLPEILEFANAMDSGPTAPASNRMAVAFAHNVNGAYELMDMKIEKAKVHFEAAQKTIKSIADVAELDARHANSFYHVWGISSINLGTCKLSEGSPHIEDGLADIEDGIQPMRILISVHPNSFLYKMQLMQAFRAKIGGLTLLGKTEDAKSVQVEMDALSDEVIQQNPDLPWVLALKSNEKSIELVDRMRKGDLSNFESDADYLLQHTSPSIRPMVIYNVLCAYAQAIKFSNTEPDLARYRDRVTSLLQELRQLKSFDDPRFLDHMKQDSDLEAISNSIDWESLKSKE